MTNCAINRRSQRRVVRLSTTRLATNIFNSIQSPGVSHEQSCDHPKTNLSLRLHSQVVEYSATSLCRIKSPTIVRLQCDWGFRTHSAHYISNSNNNNNNNNKNRSNKPKRIEKVYGIHVDEFQISNSPIGLHPLLIFTRMIHDKLIKK